MSGAIQEGLVSPSTKFDDIGQSVHVYDTDYVDVETHPTTMTVTDILAQSSNVGTIKIAGMLGKDKFAKYLDAFGFGKPTGLGFPGESAGITLPVSQYNATSLASIPIGYGIAVTAMQMLDVYATIANGGMARPPRIVAATVDAARRTPRLAVSPHPTRSCRRRRPSAVTGMLRKVVTEGTGVKAQIPGYPVAGKTGTARKAPYNTGEYVASFAGFAPADSPRLAAIVVMDSPGGSIFGADAAAPGLPADHAVCARLRAGPDDLVSLVIAAAGRYPCRSNRVRTRRGRARALARPARRPRGARRSGDVSGHAPVEIDAITHDSRLVVAGRVLRVHPRRTVRRSRPRARCGRRGRGGAARRSGSLPSGGPRPGCRAGAGVRSVRWRRLYGDPSHAMRCLGVTGTNGKTTTTYLLEAIAPARRVIAPGVIGTVGGASPVT